MPMANLMRRMVLGRVDPGSGSGKSGNYKNIA
jgi:hypothetical protein